ncbi:hypothetical protein P3T21_007434 [Paraburkholderia sp. GAS334]
MEITLAIALTVFTNTFNRINDTDLGSAKATVRGRLCPVSARSVKRVIEKARIGCAVCDVTRGYT